MPGIDRIERDTRFDDDKLRSAGIRLIYTLVRRPCRDSADRLAGTAKHPCRWGRLTRNGASRSVHLCRGCSFQRRCTELP